MDAISKDLAKWVPHLTAVWRRAKGTRNLSGSPLTVSEIREVGAAVKTLSHGLTRGRELAGARYMENPRLLGAYLLFYWPVSYAQGRQALKELPSRPRSVLDLGSGPGPLAFACLDAGAAEVIACDRSADALTLARELATEADLGLSTRAWNGIAGDQVPDGAFDLVTMGHVLNELWTDADDAVPRRVGLVERAFERVKPRGSLLILEPALKETSRGLLHVRDRLVQNGHAVRAPCFYRGGCPALTKETDWCHAERSWEPPQMVLDIARAAGLHKEALKMTYLLLAPKGEAWREPPPGKIFRIVSEPLASKGRQRYMGCGPDGRQGLALQEKHVNPGNEAFSRLVRGDVISVEGTEAKGDGLGLSEASVVTVVARAGQPLP